MVSQVGSGYPTKTDPTILFHQIFFSNVIGDWYLQRSDNYLLSPNLATVGQRTDEIDDQLGAC